MKDDYIVVLDFLSRGHAYSRKGEPLVQGLGNKLFSLLEVVLKPGVTAESGETLYIGEKKRDKVKYVKGRIKFGELTSFAKKELESIIDKIIEENEERFVEFFNKSYPISTRMHSLELLPGIGKKHLWNILEERKKKSFKSLEDLKRRVEMLPDPKRMIKKRIIKELKGKERRYLFVVAR